MKESREPEKGGQRQGGRLAARKTSHAEVPQRFRGQTSVTIRIIHVIHTKISRQGSEEAQSGPQNGVKPRAKTRSATNKDLLWGVKPEKGYQSPQTIEYIII